VWLATGSITPGTFAIGLPIAILVGWFGIWSRRIEKRDE
jgi:hypothetical protein